MFSRQGLKGNPNQASWFHRLSLHYPSARSLGFSEANSGALVLTQSDRDLGSVDVRDLFDWPWSRETLWLSGSGHRVSIVG